MSRANVSPYDPWQPGDAANSANATAMKLGSHDLLKALWRAHPAIMRKLGAKPC